MGHPKFSRRVWQGPKHPWQAERITEESDLIKNYGLGNGKNIGGHKEIWKARSRLRKWRQNAMKLIGKVDSSEGHYAREKQDLIDSLHRRGLLPEGASVDDILQITVEHVLARRLQSQVYYRGLAASMKQARQLLIHGHISVGEQVMTVPGYILTRSEEENLQYSSQSSLHDEAARSGTSKKKEIPVGPNHPIRAGIDTIRSQADYGGEEPRVIEKDGPSPEEVAELAAAVEAAPSSEDTVEGGEGQ